MLEKIPESPFICKEIQPIHSKGDQARVFIGRTDVEAEIPILWPPECEELTYLKRSCCWERLKAEGEGDDRRWDGWHHRLQWTRVWASSGSWWTGKPEVLQLMGLQRPGHDWAAELNWMHYSPPKQMFSPQKQMYLSTKFNFNLMKRVSFKKW